MINVDHYSILIQWSEQDNAYIATVPALPGCMADGATQIDAMRNARVVIQEWIDCAQADGDPIPGPDYLC